MAIKKGRKTITKNETHSIANIQSKTSTSNIEIENVEGFLKERLWFTDYFDGDKLKRFIKNVEKLVRTSNGYKSFIGSCEEKGLNRCAILGNVYKSKKVNVEIHHYPFTLYDIIFNHVMLLIKQEKKFTSISVARDILELHHEGYVSVVPLCKTIHQLVHDGQIFISLNSCAGNLAGYIEKYESIMDEDMKEKYNQILAMTEAGIAYSDSEILKKVENYENMLEKSVPLSMEEKDNQNYVDNADLKRLASNSEDFYNDEEK